MRIPERAIQAQILQYLRYRGIKAFRINAGGLRDKRNHLIRMAPKGSADIWGVMPGGRAIFVECKAEGGKLTQFQELFLQEMKEQGAVCIVARSVDDVERELEIQSDQ